MAFPTRETCTPIPASISPQRERADLNPWKRHNSAGIPVLLPLERVVRRVGSDAVIILGTVVLGGALALSDVTHILSRFESGDSAAATEPLSLVYDEQAARSQPQTLSSDSAASPLVAPLRLLQVLRAESLQITY